MPKLQQQAVLLRHAIETPGIVRCLARRSNCLRIHFPPHGPGSKKGTTRNGRRHLDNPLRTASPVTSFGAALSSYRGCSPQLGTLFFSGGPPRANRGKTRVCTSVPGAPAHYLRTDCRSFPPFAAVEVPIGPYRRRSAVRDSALRARHPSRSSVEALLPRILLLQQLKLFRVEEIRDPKSIHSPEHRIVRQIPRNHRIHFGRTAQAVSGPQGVARSKTFYQCVLRLRLRTPRDSTPSRWWKRRALFRRASARESLPIPARRNRRILSLRTSAACHSSNVRS